MPYLQLPDGVPLYYEEHGTGGGEPILLLPGWTVTTRFWQRQIGDLSRDHRILTFDLRGAGASGKTPDGHTLSGYAADLGVEHMFRYAMIADLGQLDLFARHLLEPFKSAVQSGGLKQ